MKQDDAAEIRRWHAATGHAHVSLLRWYRTVGYARHYGVSVDLDEQTVIAGSDIEYFAGSGRIDGREMTPEEIAAVRKYLVQTAEDARDVWRGNSTLVVVFRKE